MVRALYSIEETWARLGDISRNYLYPCCEPGAFRASSSVVADSCLPRRLLRSSVVTRPSVSHRRTLHGHGGRWLMQARPFVRSPESAPDLMSPTLSK